MAVLPSVLAAQIGGKHFRVSLSVPYLADREDRFSWFPTCSDMERREKGHRSLLFPSYFPLLSRSPFLPLILPPGNAPSRRLPQASAVASPLSGASRKTDALLFSGRQSERVELVGSTPFELASQATEPSGYLCNLYPRL